MEHKHALPFAPISSFFPSISIVSLPHGRAVILEPHSLKTLGAAGQRRFGAADSEFPIHTRRRGQPPAGAGGGTTVTPPPNPQRPHR